MLILLICVAADGDDTDSWTWGVSDDDGLPRGVVLVVLRVLIVWCMVLSRCAGCLLFSPSSSSTGLGWSTESRGAILYHSTAWRCILLHTLRALRGQHRLGGGHLIGGHIPETGIKVLENKCLHPFSQKPKHASLLLTCCSSVVACSFWRMSYCLTAASSHEPCPHSRAAGMAGTHDWQARLAVAWWDCNGYHGDGNSWKKENNLIYKLL